MQQRLAQFLLLLGTALLLAGCGFQLRGAGGVAVPEDWLSMHMVTGNPNSEFSREVKTSFAANGVEWQDSM